VYKICLECGAYNEVIRTHCRTCGSVLTRPIQPCWCGDSSDVDYPVFTYPINVTVTTGKEDSDNEVKTVCSIMIDADYHGNVTEAWDILHDLLKQMIAKGLVNIRMSVSE